MEPIYRLILYFESTNFQKVIGKLVNTLSDSLTKKWSKFYLLCCLSVLLLLFCKNPVYSQFPDSLRIDCTINQLFQEFNTDSMSLFPDWMHVPFRLSQIKQRQVRADRIEIEIDPLIYNFYTMQSGPYSFFTGLDDKTMKEYKTIFILDSIARSISVFADPDSILELVIFQLDTCVQERKCRIGIYDSTVGEQSFIGGVCCSNGDTSTFQSIAGMPILTDAGTGIRYIEYWLKNMACLTTSCCEIVYQYKSNNDSIPKFVFYDGPFKRPHFQYSCYEGPFQYTEPYCPIDNKTPEEVEKRRCKRCQTPAIQD